ncbi:uncharacterized protein V1510DRAFT_413677 [Dipodascopsis tothii]|uniref:uncharacterized protein n=1 Tax=Dipodascopsis tothii TaxID=44089 RepID=UPI0034CE96D5
MGWLSWLRGSRATGDDTGGLDFLEPDLREFYVSQTPKLALKRQLSAAQSSGDSELVTILKQTETGQGLTLEQRVHELEVAASANCAIYELALSDCLTKGTLIDRKIKMCASQSAQFSACKQAQKKILRTMGYMANGRQPTLDHRVRREALEQYERERAADAKAWKDSPVQYLLDHGRKQF